MFKMALLIVIGATKVVIPQHSLPPCKYETFEDPNHSTWNNRLRGARIVAVNLCISGNPKVDGARLV